jgi:hypothetical protein
VQYLSSSLARFVEGVTEFLNFSHKFASQLYHPDRHVKMKIISAILLVVACVGTAFTAGVTIGASQAGQSQYAAEKKTMDMYQAEWWSSSDSSEEEDTSSAIEDNVSYGGYCWSCSENSQSRMWK